MQDATPLPNSELSLAELELQNELRGMFELDTQTYLQTYEQVTQDLSTDAWSEQIQELYRAIHTIKGGAVTVGANAVLATTTALEDMLSDLRYLQSPPILENGNLSGILVEAGEVVSASLLILDTDEDAEDRLANSLSRLEKFHDQVKAQFLVEIDEHQQICQDFANQGFDLMVLDLEMALEAVPENSHIPGELVNTAAQILSDLESVGKDLEMGSGWSMLIQPLFELLIESDSEIWRSRIQTYLPFLKACALEAGELTDEAKAQLSQDGIEVASSAVEAEVDDELDFTLEATLDVSEEEEAADFVSPELDFLLDDVVTDTEKEDVAETLLEEEEEVSLDWLTTLEPEESVDAIAESAEAITAEDAFVEEPLAAEEVIPLLTVEESIPELVPDEAEVNYAKEGQLLGEALKQIETVSEEVETPETLAAEVDAFEVPDGFLESLNITPQAEEAEETVDLPEWLVESADEPVNAKATLIQEANVPAAKIPKIPVPLDRLDRSAQALVEILLATRATQGRYQALQNQLAQMVSLSQDSSAYITQLRQMQDDYALLQDLSHQSSESEGVKLEGYRSGYSAINRLLENSLRLTELGAEVAASAQVTKQEFNKLNYSIKSLQNSVEESRLISFKSVAFRLRAVVQDLINRIGKPVQFVIEGESQNVDAGTIQVIEPALLHLLRNAYDHGLESVEDRQKTEKPQEASIKLSLRRQGSFYNISLVDDGKGINPAKIAAIATEKGLPFCETDTPDNLLKVICQPGFSSQTEVSAVSGRGVGMDVVHHQVASVGGSIKLDSTIGQGTKFEIRIPVPHLLVPCIVVKAASQLYAIPTDAIQTMRVWDNTCQVNTDTDSALPWERQFEGKTEAMLPISQYWQERATVPDLDEARMETAVCLRIPGLNSEDALWLVIDDLVEELDLLISNIPSPLKAPAGMMGMSTLSTGEMVPVLDASVISDVLLRTVENEITIESTTATIEDEASDMSDSVNHNLILVVDDAALLRRRLEVSLLNYGYEVQCCRDGLDAWNWLQENPTPGLMITDIEMPQMDGFTLVDRCRQSGMAFPILVSSSRLSEEWSKEAKRVGANDYLTKGFTTNELIDRVSGLMETAVAT